MSVADEFSEVSFLIYVLFIDRVETMLSGRRYPLASPSPRCIIYDVPSDKEPALLTSLLLSLGNRFISVEEEAKPLTKSINSSGIEGTKPFAKSSGGMGVMSRRYSSSPARSSPRWIVKFGENFRVECNDLEALEIVLSKFGYSRQ